MGAIESPTRFKLTIEQYYKMGEAGVFPPEARVELIFGEIYQMPPIGGPHSGTVIRLTQVFSLRLGTRVQVSVQGPVSLPMDSEPQPDLMLLRPRPDFYTTRHAQADDVLLVVEVADTSLAFDRGIKAKLYAERSIVEYWIVDVKARQIEVHRAPTDSGYASISVLTDEATIAPLALGECVFTLGELLG
ncbi:MAG: Uma2 family endonuclease [Proteobacteria bacterium]|nr:Uma2 family endonuclease [Burkholderiales bacterium]